MDKVGNIWGIRGMGVEVLGNISLVNSTSIKGDDWLKDRLVCRVKSIVRCMVIPIVGERL